MTSDETQGYTCRECGRTFPTGDAYDAHFTDYEEFGSPGNRRFVVTCQPGIRARNAALVPRDDGIPLLRLPVLGPPER